MSASANAEIVRGYTGAAPVEAALILGSGLSGIGDALEDRTAVAYADLNGFPAGGVSGHGKELRVGELSGRRIAVLTGRQHYYEHGNAAAMRPALETVAELGAQTLLLTNSAGSLDRAISPGNPMLIRDHLNYAGANPLIGEPTDARFVNMVDAYDPGLRQRTREIADRLGVPLAEGVYMWYSGPSFETPAEIEMAVRLGANAVGMSTVPEAILGRFLGLRVWACSSITNFGAGMLAGETISHEQTKAVGQKGAGRLQRLIVELVREL